jgi:hypothetical protein
MAKSSKKNRKSTITQSKSIETKTFFFEKERNVDYLLLAVTAIFLIVLLKPMVVDRLSPQGVDVVASQGRTHQVGEYAKKSGEPALWNPYIFGGMPLYHRLKANLWSPDKLLALIGRLFSMVFIYYLFAALGMYLIFRYLKMTPVISFLGMMLFILMPHYKSLYLEGHMAKFYALMIMPWIFLTFLYFLDKRNLLSISLFGLVFGMQIRTQHYQIVFYTALLIFSVGVYPILKDIFDKNYKRFSTSVIMIIVAVALGISLAAQPLFSAKEYLPYSKRGKTTIDLSKQKQEQSTDAGSGVSMQYATQWSTAPSEMLTWIIPRIYGGMSSEKYSGSAVPRLRNQVIPGYWGEMPFTQSYEYMGILTLLLAVIGLYANRKNKMIISLFIFMVFLIFLSFGRHFETFYSIFYYYFPFFNKFRTPMMSVTVTFFLMSIFAVYGLKYLIDVPKGKSLAEYKPVFMIIGVFAGLGLLVWLFSMNFSYLKTGEQYNQQIQTLLISIRKEYLNQDLIRYFIILAVGAAVIWAALSAKMKMGVAVAVLILLSIADLVNIQARDHKDFIDVKKVERRYFHKTATDQYLLQDKEIYRVFPAGKLFGDNRWVYYHQSIGGYSPIKMYTIEELIANNLYNGPDRTLPFNWNMLKFLDVKYVIAQQKINHPYLKLANTDNSGKLFTYLFTKRLQRGFFVGKYKVINDEYERLKTINRIDFDAAETAILEEKLNAQISTPDSQSVELIKFTPNHSQYDVYTDKTALFVISELFYPPGWKITIDGHNVENIYKTDHAIQSIVVSAGNHKIELNFEPNSYYRNVKISYASLGILYLVILLGFYKGKGAELINAKRKPQD